MSDNNLFNKSDEVSRRQFMASAAKTCLGVSVLPMLGNTVATEDTFGAAAPPMRPHAARSVIYLNMSGGMSHLDTFDPKPSNKDVQGPTPVIGTSADDIQISGYLPKTAKNRLHLDITVTERGMDADLRHRLVREKVNALIALGATEGETFDGEQGHWIVMADPEGNEFCVQ